MLIHKKLVLIGYSGHSFGCIEISKSLGWSVIGYHDLYKKDFNPYDLNYLGKEEKINLKWKSFISIGDNNLRKKVFEKFSYGNKSFEINLIHKNSIISSSSKIPYQTFVGAGALINSNVKMGIGCIINTGAIIEHDSSIGKFTHVAPGAVVCGNVSIGDQCMIGANSVIKQGVKIDNNVIIGAGSVVLSDIKSNTIFAGNPAKQIKSR